MIQRMAIRRMYEQLPKLGIHFAIPAIPMGMMARFAAAAGVPDSAVANPQTTTATTATNPPAAAAVPPKAAE
jgi:hypothetical protein